MRSLDIGYTFAFDLGVPLRTTANKYGTVNTGLTRYKSMTALAFMPPVYGGGGADECQISFQEAGPPSLTHQNIFNGVDAGGVGSNDGTNNQIAIPFTQPVAGGNLAPTAALLWLSRVGNPSGTPAMMEVSLRQDNGGVPGAITQSTYFLDVRNIPQTITPFLFGWQTIPFDVPVGAWWLVLVPYYTPDATNHIKVHYNTVAGSSGCLRNDGAWQAMANEYVWFKLYQHEWFDVPASEIEGGNFALYAEDQVWVNWNMDSIQSRVVDLSRRKDNMRSKVIVSGGAWQVIVLATITNPLDPPVQNDVTNYSPV